MQEKPSIRRPNRERSESTRSTLVAAARELFVEKTYAETSTPEIASVAGVTRGALYHHFADKQALFRAVILAESQAVAEEIDRATPDDLPPRKALAKGGEAFLEAMSVAGRSRLLLLDGPAVLGRAAMDEIDARHGNRTLKAGLAAAIGVGQLPRLPIDAVTALLGAMFDRAALAIADGGEPDDYRNVIEAIIEGLGRAA